MHIAIIGAGIAGLYSAFLLEQKYPKAQIDIYEASNHLGGRIMTFKPNDSVQVEAGAGRIGEHHYRVWNLFKKYNASWTKLEAPKKYLDNPSYNISKDYKKIRDMYNRTSKKELEKLPFKVWAAKYTNIDIEKFVNAFGYSGKFELMSAYDAGRAIIEEFEYSFYGIISGIDTIVKGLKNDISANIHVNTPVENITTAKTVYFSSGKTRQPDMVVVAVPIQRIPHWDILKNTYTQAIGSKPLQRIYAHCPGLKLSNRYTTTSYLRYIIPISNKNNIHMVSYTDNRYTNSWQLVDNKEELLEKEMKDIFNVSVKNSWFFYWDIGTSYWVPGRKNMFKLPKIYNLYIVGESVSEYHSWIEGALKSVEKVLK